VIGGGLAGLACARELGESCTLLEAEDRLGGLCRTDVIDGFSFDWTGHWLHARDPEMRKAIEERWLAGNLLHVQRRARIHSEGVWTTFPYQFHLHGLPPRIIADCVLGFIDATLGPAARSCGPAAAECGEFILRDLGEGSPATSCFRTTRSSTRFPASSSHPNGAAASSRGRPCRTW